MANNYEYRSICQVISPTEDNRQRLARLADIDKDGNIIPFKADPDSPKYYSNRTTLYFADGPSYVGTIGVWDWTPIPNKTDPSKDFHTPKYNQSIKPIVVYSISSCNKLSQVLSQLNKGIVVPNAARVLFTPGTKDASCLGILCLKEQLYLSQGRSWIDKKLVSLPVHKIKRSDIIEIGNGISIYKNLSIGDPVIMAPVKPPLETVNQIVKNRAAWNTFKEVGKTRSEWKVVKEFLDGLDTTSIVEEVSAACNCSEEEAKGYINKYINHAKTYIDGNSIDDKMLAAIIYGNKDLYARCVRIVEENLDKENEPFIKQKEEEKTKLLQEIEKIQSEKGAKETKLLKEIEKIQSEYDARKEQIVELENTIAKLDDDITSKRKLSNDLEQEVAKQLNDAKENTAKFMAQMAMFGYSPISNETSSASNSSMLSNATELDDRDLDVLNNWKDALDVISYELISAGVKDDVAFSLGAYLYSADINHMPIILAGPNAIDIANAYSAARYGRIPARFDCLGEFNSTSAKELQSVDEPIVIFCNAFSSNWIRQIPEIISNKNYFSIICHPFSEDLQIEPESFYCSALPLYTDLLIDKTPSGSFKGGIQADNYSEYVSKKSGSGLIADGIFDKLRITPLPKNNIIRVLLDANNMTSKDHADNAVLFALLPYARATGTLSVLLDLIDNSDNRIKISKELKTELFDFFGDHNG
ncbi:hypothetical protein SAMN02910264_02312 [Ruminococcaceae bacterium YAD3003]|nr:hypothetical protein SAMN02910264_02312 [Ruminococcaceae bacterium YAD3003]